MTASIKPPILLFSPTECKVICLNNQRDVLPGNRQIYALQAEFNFNQVSFQTNLKYEIRIRMEVV